MKTERLELVPLAAGDLLALVESEGHVERRFGVRPAEGLRGFIVSGEVSPEYLARLRAGGAADPWAFGFAVVHGPDRAVVGWPGSRGRRTRTPHDLRHQCSKTREGSVEGVTPTRPLPGLAIMRCSHGLKTRATGNTRGNCTGERCV